MTVGQRGRPRVALVFAGALSLASATAAELRVTDAGTGEALGHLSVPEGGGWMLLWNHSVQGFEVEDHYRNVDGAMVLIRSHLPDFAAGLDHIPGRGRQVSDGQGGYWIEDLDEPVAGNALILRPGDQRVNHRLQTTTGTLNLTALGAGRRLRIALVEETGQ